MFHSFFPRPRLLLLSAIVWIIVVMASWYLFGKDLGHQFGMGFDESVKTASVYYLFSPHFMWFNLYYLAAVALFATFWRWYHPHKWQFWSIWVGSLLIYFAYFSVSVDVALNAWQREFYDNLQNILAGKLERPAEVFYGNLWLFLSIAFIAIFASVVNSFITSHFAFRWRQAMNDHYLERWQKLRHIEGAAQRVQDDTFRLARGIESLGIRLVDSVMTLIAFLPILIMLGKQVEEVPIIGAIPYPLLTCAIIWSIGGTIWVALWGVKLPQLEFNIQKEEAAYRKELVYGEDDEKRADKEATEPLFRNVRAANFRSYFHYVYFNIARIFYLQVDVIFVYILLAPVIIAAKISLGFVHQTAGAFSRVANSFQFLVNSWPAIVELMSIYKRLQAFEAAIDNEPLPNVDQEYLDEQNS